MDTSSSHRLIIVKDNCPINTIQIVTFFFSCVLIYRLLRLILGCNAAKKKQPGQI